VLRCPSVSFLSATHWALIGFLLLLVSLSSDSIDMLESQTWDYARHETFSGFCNELKADSNAESHMPFGMFSFWGWSRLFGTGELAMRSLNLLWAAIALASLARVGRHISLPWLPLLFAIQPFVWYHMNYARTPLMQMAGGALLMTGALGCIYNKARSEPDGMLLCLGAILLSGANMVGLVPLVAIAAGLTMNGIWHRLRYPLLGKAILFSTLVTLALLGLYYTSLLLNGKESSPLWTVTPANILFACYEFLGLQGFGPARQELRAILKGFAPPGEILPFLPGLLCLPAAYLLVFSSAFKSWMTRNFCPPAPGGDYSCGGPSGLPLVPAWLMGLGTPLLSAFLLFLIAWVADFPFWGRHLAGTFPFWILALAITIRWAQQGLWRKTGRFAGRALLVLLLVSSLLIRFAPYHRHDDYRSAVVEALRLSTAGKVVWWVADASGGVFYGLPLVETSTNKPGEIQYAMNRMEIPAELPDAIVLSRPDNFDPQGSVSRMLNSGGYTKACRFQAFEIWVRHP